jgi:catechol 2,3-dioxygenase-like lactoylglutathione lyase family enzyme
MEISGITRNVTNLQQAKAFYEQVLGLSPSSAYEPTRWQSYQMQEGLYLAVGEPPGSFDSVALAVPDLDAFWAKVRGQAEVVHPLAVTPWGTRRFVVRDPDGNLLTFTEKKTSGAQEMLRGQYQAELHMLKDAVVRCPAGLWDDPRDENRFWQIAYHALFFLHLYLHDSLAVFRAWEGHRKDYEQMGPFPWDRSQKPVIGEPYSKSQVLAFWQVCSDFVDASLPGMALSGPSGFDWLPFDKLGLQVYNLRHFQQHVGELMERLGSRAGISVDWQVLP